MFRIHESLGGEYRICRTSRDRGIIVWVEHDVWKSYIGRGTPYIKREFTLYNPTNSIGGSVNEDWSESKEPFTIIKHFREFDFRKVRLDSGSYRHYNDSFMATGGVTFVFKESYGLTGVARYEVHISVCSDKDNYNKKVGVKKALERTCVDYISAVDKKDLFHTFISAYLKDEYSYDEVRSLAKKLIRQ